MPKIIENIQERLLEEARRQVLKEGYSSMTIRSVATACGVGVGTVYNYFKSKDMLVASFMLEDWMVCQQVISENCKKAQDVREALYGMYTELGRFKEKYMPLFSDEGAKSGFFASAQQRHGMLTSQLAQPLRVWTEKQNRVPAQELATFAAENILTMTMREVPFDNIAMILLQLF